MNMKIVLKLLGTVLLWEAVLMLPSLFISIADNSYDIDSFIISIMLTGVIGFLMTRINAGSSQMRKREGFVCVSLCWVIMSLLGALPFYISRAIPSYLDCVFETVSGFTTTGSSIVRDIESFPRGLLFWRSFTHWIGGMGVLVFTLALMPSIGARSVFLMRAESPGPSPGKLVPRISETAKILYVIYAAMTAVLIILLIIAGMPVFNSFIYAFGTAGTGGFGMDALSVGAYNSPIIDWIITIGMFLFGVNFTLYYLLLKGDWKGFLKNEEFRLYGAFIVISTILICINILPRYDYSVGTSLTHSAFTVSTLATTTGYATADFNQWPMFSKTVLMMLMFIGASAGSTAGGLKYIRVVVLFKTVINEIKHTIHPNSVTVVKVDGKTVDTGILTGIFIFFFTYVTILIVAVIIVSLDNFDFMTTFSSVVATLSNIGPGFELVGPMGNFADFSVLSKITLIFCMIIGRLEVLPILILFSPQIWKRN